MSKNFGFDPLFILVTGATGNQGGSVARRLLEHGHRVRALTRKPDSPAANELEKLGAEISVGNFNDRNSLERAATDVDAIFAMGTSFEEGTVSEPRQAIAIAETAKKLDIGHLVYSSVGSADQNTGIPHFESKYKVEQHIESLGIPYTIFGPVFFCENHVFEDWAKKVDWRILDQPVPQCEH
ncbi:MAG: NmrA/HSCARG family protein [Promethearchaeota archaeon]